MGRKRSENSLLNAGFRRQQKRDYKGEYVIMNTKDFKFGTKYKQLCVLYIYDIFNSHSEEFYYDIMER